VRIVAGQKAAVVEVVYLLSSRPNWST
jgi:hypothetical protein